MIGPSRFLLVANLLFFPLAPAAAKSLRTDYAVSIRGIVVGTALLEAEVDGELYSAQFSGGIVGLARLFSDARTSAHATGRMDAGSLRPEEYEHLWIEDNEAETVELRFSGPTLTEISLDPPRDRPERYVPITAEQKTNVLDPVSAFLWPSPSGATPATCDRTVPVFDGKRRFDLTLSFIRRDTFRAGAATPGEAVVCGVRYRPVSGHRANGKGGGFLKDGKGMEIWMAAAGEGLVAPVRIQIDTRIGRIVFRATKVRSE